MNRVLGLGLAAAVMVVLAGCGGSPSTTPAATQAPASSPSTSAAPSPDAPASDAPSSEAPSTEPSDSGGGDSGSKPSKSEIVAGLSKFYTSSQGLSSAKAQKFASCMVDQMYDKAKVATLEAMRDGDPTKLDKSDAGLLAESAVKCEPALK